MAVIGSVAKALWKELPRFPEFRRERIEVWHECKDIDLALWLDSQERLGALRRAAAIALRDAGGGQGGIGVADHEVDVFLIEPGTDLYLGRLCHFNQCPKGHRDCLVPNCGATPFKKRVAEFTTHSDLLAAAQHAMLYVRGVGRFRSALDLPWPQEATLSPTDGAEAVPNV